MSIEEFPLRHNLYVAFHLIKNTLLPLGLEVDDIETVAARSLHRIFYVFCQSARRENFYL